MPYDGTCCCGQRGGRGGFTLPQEGVLSPVLSIVDGAQSIRRHVHKI